jgi:hypothetical protein
VDPSDISDETLEALEAGHHPVIDADPGLVLDGLRHQLGTAVVQTLIDLGRAVARDVDPRVTGDVDDPAAHLLGVDPDEVDRVGARVRVPAACVATHEQDVDLAVLGLERAMNAADLDGRGRALFGGA